MTIPKKKYYYRVYSTAMALCLGLSMLIVTFTGMFAQALTFPETIKGSEAFHQRDDPKSERQAQQQNAKNLETKPVVLPAPSVTVPANQRSKPAPVVQDKIQHTVAPAVNIVAAPVNAPTPTTPSVDTSAESRQLTAAQTVKPTKAQEYASAKISNYERNQFYKTSILATAFGATLYAISYAPIVWAWARRTVTLARNPIATQ